MSMLEKAARAVGEVPTWDGNNMSQELTPDEITSIVRAVLLAIREPDDAMMSAAIRKGQDVGYTDIIAVHRAIIDAALAE